MANNRDKIDQIHDLMPAHFNTRTNDNWKALINALGSSDQSIVDLITEVKKQFFIKTAYRPYIDNLGANSGVARPPRVGMSDTTYKNYIPILAYTPKQVKLIIDQLLNIFFNKETTTAHVVSGQIQPFLLQDEWELEYVVDGVNTELIHFYNSDFTNIAEATAQEIAAVINRQAQYSFAEDYYDNVTKGFYIKLFSKTIGSKGSIQVIGGRVNIPLQFNGFIVDAGTGVNTQWTITKIGDKVTYQYTSGNNPNLNLIQVGDVVVSLLPNNEGSFAITNINLSANSITFVNLFGTPGIYTQTDPTQVKFFTPNKYVVYTRNTRAVTWEVNPGETIVEMPATPPVVRRALQGAMHVNGSQSIITMRNSGSSINVENASEFPMSGSFWLQEVEEIKTRYYTPSEDTLASTTFNGRLQGEPVKYTYTSRLVLQTTGDTIIGSKQITNLASVVGIAIGQNVFMAGVPSYALVTEIFGNTVTIDFPATQTATAEIVRFAGNTLIGITPPVPELAALDENVLTSLVRSSNVMTATTALPHDYQVGQTVSIYNSSGIVTNTATGTISNGSTLITGVAPPGTIATGLLIIGPSIPAQTYVENIVGPTVTMTQPATAGATQSIDFSENLNGAFIITSVTSNTFTYGSIGTNGSATTPGTARVDSMGLASSGTLVIITNALPSSFTRMNGTYVWDLSAPFVLSENTATTFTPIQVGDVKALLNLSPNTIDPDGGFIMFDYGLKTQEGPVRYLYAPNDSALVLDPSYTFQFNHPVGSNVVSIRNKGPHLMSGLGSEYPPYITNPGDVRITLEKLILSVASSGIFINFLIRYPEQLYGTLDVYQISG